MIDKIQMTDKIQLILNTVKKQVMPDLSVLKDVDKILNIINNELKNLKIPAECVKGGSIAKETFLKNDYDADIFVRFDASFDKDFSNTLEIALKNAFPKINIERIHGSRDYFQFKEKIKGNKTKKNDEEINYEIIPVMKIHASNYKDAKNVTDLSPEHVFWVEKYTKLKPELKDEIRLAKQFCKANKVYGAESYINGFSGHMIDILIIHYGSFIELINEASKWGVEKNKKIIIDHEKHLKNPLKELNESKLISPLIMVDPIQIDRNAAAAMSQEKFEIFITACKEFLKTPDENFFEIKKFEITKEIQNKIKIIKKELKNTHSKIKIINKKTVKSIILKIKTLDGSKDIVGTKILKIFELLNIHTALNDFKIIFSDWNFDFEKRNAEMYFIVDNETLSVTIEQMGPPIKEKKDYDNFIQKHTQNKNKIFTKNNRVYAIIPRKYLFPEKLLADLIKENFIFSRAREIKINKIEEINLG